VAVTETAAIATVTDKASGQVRKRYRQLRGEVRRRIEGGALESPQSRAEFLRWLRSQQRELILAAATLGAGAASAALGAHWIDKFVRSAFSTGWRHGARALADSNQGGDVSIPKGAEAVSEQISGSTPGVSERRREVRDNLLSDLADAVNDTAAEVERVLAESVREGRSTEETISAVNDRLEKVGVTRGRQIAAYHLADAHTRASAERYRTRGVREVRVVNPDPCPEICAEKVGPTYSIREAVTGDLCPFHPFCVGVVLPA
jgi:hypothetical protein